MKFLMITNNKEIANFACGSGVNQIFIDLEIDGKIERQGHLNTVISHHTIDDVIQVKKSIPNGTMLVRVNPLSENSDKEINEVILAGADTVMLPMFRGSEDVSNFIEIVNGRVKCCLLVETTSAIKSYADWLNIPGIDQIHIGLNDLHLDLGHEFMFQPLADGVIDALCFAIKQKGIPFGIGGLARVGEGMLSADLVLAEHVRLGSTWAILSRTFHRQANSVEEINAHMNFSDEIKKLRDKYNEFKHKEEHELNQIHVQVQASVKQIIELIRTRKLVNKSNR